MGSIGYTTLSRQSGLLNEMQAVANNIANSATTGYRSEGLIFSEYVKSAPGQESLSMGRANIRNTSLEQGTMSQTNGTAITTGMFVPPLSPTRSCQVCSGSPSCERKPPSERSLIKSAGFFA